MPDVRRFFARYGFWMVVRRHAIAKIGILVALILCIGTTPAGAGTPGSVDPSYAPIEAIRSGLFLPDQSGGYLVRWGLDQNRVAVIAPWGDFGVIFTSPSYYSISALAHSPGGKILVGFSTMNFNQNRLWRLLEDGSVDRDFHQPIFGSQNDFPRINSILVEAEGSIVVTGFFFEVDGHVTKSIARLHADGTVDTTFAVNEWSAAEVQSI